MPFLGPCATLYHWSCGLCSAACDIKQLFYTASSHHLLFFCHLFICLLLIEMDANIMDANIIYNYNGNLGPWPTARTGLTKPWLVSIYLFPPPFPAPGLFLSRVTTQLIIKPSLPVWSRDNRAANLRNYLARRRYIFRAQISWGTHGSAG